MQAESTGLASSFAAVCAVNAGHEWLRMRRNKSWSGCCPVDTGGVQEALEALETHAMGRGEGGGDVAVAVGGNQLGDVALTEALAQAPRTLRTRSRGHAGLMSAAVWQCHRSAAWAVCE